ncbi:MAG: hypothetical protein FJ291_01670 [Planctomycetes bacterium]|nr:hypothetical protein [Planctomycetota bacterium]
MRGTLSVRRLTCGKRSCRCHAGQMHLALYLTFGKEGRVHQVFVPKEAEAQVRLTSPRAASPRPGSPAHKLTASRGGTQAPCDHPQKAARI